MQRLQVVEPMPSAEERASFTDLARWMYNTTTHITSQQQTVSSPDLTSFVNINGAACGTAVGKHAVDAYVCIVGFVEVRGHYVDECIVRHVSPTTRVIVPFC